VFHSALKEKCTLQFKQFVTRAEFLCGFKEHMWNIRNNVNVNTKHKVKTVVHQTGAQPALQFWGGQFSWNFSRWRHRAYSTVVQIFANGYI